MEMSQRVENGIKALESFREGVYHLVGLSRPEVDFEAVRCILASAFTDYEADLAELSQFVAKSVLEEANLKSQLKKKTDSSEKWQAEYYRLLKDKLEVQEALSKARQDIETLKKANETLVKNVEKPVKQPIFQEGVKHIAARTDGVKPINQEKERKAMSGIKF